MRALDRKLVRDLRRMKGQALSIGLVVACGVAIFVASLSTYDSLTENRRRYYADSRFAEVFASLERAPNAVRARLAAIPGVRVAETRIVEEVPLSLPDVDEPVSARLVSVPQPESAQLNRLRLRQGRFVEPGSDREVLVDAEFATEHRLHPGDALVAILNGRRQELRVAGIAMSAEFVASVRPGEVLPDPRHFGVLWMDREGMAAGFNMEGAFNDVLIGLGPGAGEREVVAAVDRVLEPWGGLGAYGRGEQASHRYVSDELEELRAEATLIPVIFLAVAAFLLNVVVGRLVSVERSQIATLKALGYSSRSVGIHYLELVLGITLAGTLLGIGGGALMGRGWSGIYAVFFHFPAVLYRMQPWVPVAAAAFSLASATLGTLTSVRQAVSLVPAEAMRPPAPQGFRLSLLERLGLRRILSTQGRMLVRSLERRPLRAAFTILGVAAATGILVVGSFWRDSIAYLLDVQFSRVQREDATVTFRRVVSTRAEAELLHVPGVLYVEGVRAIAVTLRFENRSRRTAVLGLRRGSTLHALRGVDGRPAQLPEEGVVLSKIMADILHVRIGDLVTVEAHEGARPVRQVPVTGIVEELIGLSAYMDRDALNRLMGEGHAVSAALVRLDEARARAAYAQLREMPEVVSVTLKGGLLRMFNETFAGIILVFSGFLSVFAGVIVFGVVYNSARIMLAERSWELASLRVLGFTRGEIKTLLLGELVVLVAAGIPVGMLVGWSLGLLSIRYMGPEAIAIPLVISSRTYAFAALVVVAAAVLSALLIRRRLDELDLVAVLKARE